MSTTLIETTEAEDRYLAQIEALADSRPEVANVLLTRLLAPLIPRVPAVEILCELRDATPATLKNAGGCLWLHPTPEQREGFAFLAGNETLPKPIRTLGRVALKLADKVFWEDTHALGLRCCVWQAKVALKQLQEERNTDD